MKLKKCAQCPVRFSGFSSNLCEKCRHGQKMKKLGTLAGGVEVRTDIDFSTGSLNVYASRRVSKKRYAVATRLQREAVDDANADGYDLVKEAAEFVSGLLTSDGYEKWHTPQLEAVRFVPMPQKVATVKNTTWSNLMTPPASLSVKEFQEAIIAMENMPDDSGAYKLPSFEDTFKKYAVDYYGLAGKAGQVLKAGAPVYVSPTGHLTMTDDLVVTGPISAPFALSPFDKEFLPSIGVTGW